MAIHVIGTNRSSMIIRTLEELKLENKKSELNNSNNIER